ncbi:MAG: CpsD/CapB family tyrosine-protein kinase [Ruminococcaceae bacterium]|nr:CpsD/CapB family tyrosine-protein kinase [Oscillospiraceae bacterium]
MAIKSSKQTSGEKVINTELNKTPFAIVESYKNLRTNLISIISKANGKILAISSPNAAEGKSTTALNIAITLSQLNKKVVILDTDSRKPSIHKKAKLNNEKGCMDILLGQNTISDVVIHYNNYLDVITSGSKVKNPSELFSTETFDNLLSQLEEQYDYVILDTPPINVVSDTLIIAQKSSALVMVIRAGVTKYEAFEYAYDSLKVLDIELDGVIVNGSGGKGGGYYSKNRYNSYRYNNSYENK